MATEKDNELVTQLLLGTNSGKIDWQPTARENQFTTSVKGKYAFVISQATSTSDTWLQMVDPDGRIMHTIRDDDDFRVRFLFDGARRRAFRVDEAIDDILGELGKDK